LKNYSNLEVREYLRAENLYTGLVLSQYKNLQIQIKKELDQIQDLDKIDIWEYGSWLYYTIQPPDMYPRYYRQLRTSCGFVRHSTDELVIDYNSLIAPNEAYFMAGIFEISSDGNLLALGYDLKGNEEFLIRIWDLEKKKEIQIPQIYTYYSVRWFKIDNRVWLYYNVVDSGIPRIIRRICVENCLNAQKIEPVYVESDLSMTTELKLSADLKYLFIKVIFNF
jgi:protease II